MRKEVRSKQIVPSLFDNVQKACQKAIDTKFPIMLHGDQGTGKSYGVSYFAYMNKMDITVINASVVLRKKEGQQIVRNELLRPSKKLKFFVVDEVEKDTSQLFLAEMVKLNRRIASRTNVIMICITNHYWQLKSLKSAFGAFAEEIKPPFIKEITAALIAKKVKYKGQVIRDLRFFRNVLNNPTPRKDIGISENTFSAIASFLNSNISERNIWATEVNLNAPFHKWVLSNFHHGTFNFFIKPEKGNQRMSYPKHNSAMYHRLSEALSLADLYGSKQLLNFCLPPKLIRPNLLHPSTLKKRNLK